MIGNIKVEGNNFYNVFLDYDYSIISMINHEGSSQGGHYTCVTKVEEHQFYFMSDL